MRTHIGVLILLTHKSKVIWKKIPQVLFQAEVNFPPLSVITSQHPKKPTNKILQKEIQLAQIKPNQKLKIPTTKR